MYIAEATVEHNNSYYKLITFDCISLNRET